MTRKISILTMTAGAGHNQAAKAIQGALAREEGPLDVEVMDGTKMGTRWVRRFYNDNYLWLIERSPAFWGFLYDRYDRQLSKRKQKLKAAFRKANSRQMARYLQERNPDLCLCTHFYPAELALELRAKGHITGKIAVLITDYQPHAFWVLEGVDRYYVADEETRWNLHGRGIPLERIEVTGIPVDVAFTETADRESCREKLGLDPALFTVLVASGGMGVGPMETMVDEVLSLPGSLQVVVICGKNEALRQRLAALPVPAGKTVVVNGFVTNMNEWMSASDLLVSKCGGLTTAEALSLGLPMVIVNPVPGQEVQNAEYLLERGVAVRALEIASLAYKIRGLMEEPYRLQEMRDRMVEIARPEAAADLARRSLELIEEQGGAASGAADRFCARMQRVA